MIFGKKTANPPAKSVIWNPTIRSVFAKKHEKTSFLDKVKDGLELVRNIVFGSGVIVVAGVVSKHPESLGSRSLGLAIVFFLGILAVAYLLASVIYFESRHWAAPPKDWRDWAGFLFRFTILLIAVEGTIIFVIRNIDWSIKAERDQVASVSVKGSKNDKHRASNYSFPVAKTRSSATNIQSLGSAIDLSYLRDEP